MKTRVVWLCLLPILSIVAVWFFVNRESGTSSREDTASLPSADAENQQLSREQKSAMTKYLTTLGDKLERAGLQKVPPVVEQIRRAIASKDHGALIRAFHEAIYANYEKQSVTLPVVKACLADADPFVRLHAARTLYIAGDRSGYETLVSIVKAKDAISEDDQALRIEAAKILTKFREDEASVAVLELYQRTQDLSVLNATVMLSREKTPPEIIQVLLKEKYSAFSIFNLAFAESPEVIAAAEAMFANPKVPENYQQEVKNIAAWALIRSGRKEPYLSYLTEQAERAIANEIPKGTGVDTNQYKKAFKYLGSTNDPTVHALLESALDSSSSDIVQCAVVNLLFNQPGGSEKAKQVVLKDLRGEQHKLGFDYDLTLSIAAQLDDPDIQAAGKALDQRAGRKSWQLYSVERRNWPIYNWIDNYVIDLKR